MKTSQDDPSATVQVQELNFRMIRLTKMCTGVKQGFKQLETPSLVIYLSEKSIKRSNTEARTSVQSSGHAVRTKRAIRENLRPSLDASRPKWILAQSMCHKGESAAIF